LLNPAKVYSREKYEKFLSAKVNSRDPRKFIPTKVYSFKGHRSVCIKIPDHSSNSCFAKK